MCLNRLDVARLFHGNVCGRAELRKTTDWCIMEVMANSSLPFRIKHTLTCNKALGSRSPGLNTAMHLKTCNTHGAQALNAHRAFAVPFVPGEKCSHHHAHGRSRTRATTCQVSDSAQVVDRRGMLGAGISLAAAVQLRFTSPANAVVVSKEWEKVTVCYL